MTEPEPKVYAPEGSVFQLGGDVLNGWQGRWLYAESNNNWYSAEWCRLVWPKRILEVRRVPEKTVNVELPESLARWIADSNWVTEEGSAVCVIFKNEVKKLNK